MGSITFPYEYQDQIARSEGEKDGGQIFILEFKLALSSEK
jgi:hypothetical protein